MQPPSPITVQQLTAWADAALRINHLNTLVQREIEAKHLVRAAELSERARRSAWEMLNQLFASGAVKPEGYAEPGSRPTGSTDV
jgi:hypothetical protein